MTVCRIGLNLSHFKTLSLHTILVTSAALGLNVEVDVGSSEVGLSRPTGDGLTTKIFINQFQFFYSVL